MLRRFDRERSQIIGSTSRSRGSAMRDASIGLLVVAGLLGGRAAGPEQGTLSAFAEVPSGGPAP